MRISDWSSDVCSSDLPPRLWRGRASLHRIASRTDRDPRVSGRMVQAYPGSDICRQRRDGDTRWPRMDAGRIADPLVCAPCPNRARFLKIASCGMGWGRGLLRWRSEEHTSELQSLMRISYAVFCLK